MPVFAVTATINDRWGCESVRLEDLDHAYLLDVLALVRCEVNRRELEGVLLSRCN